VLSLPAACHRVTGSGTSTPHKIDWQPHITQWLAPWASHGISKEALDLACDALANTTHIHEQVCTAALASCCPDP
jgi:hypothetical protein